MEVKTIYKDEKTHVVAVYLASGKLFYTRTYTYDDEGFVEKNITVFANGTIDAQ